MSDLIDRQAAIDAAIEAVDEWDGGYNLRRADMIADAINNSVPSAQPEIIRCKDCENLQTDWKPQDSDGYYCAVMDRMMEEDGFCSHAERKENVQ